MRPCPQALSALNVPATRFRTRAELLALVESVRIFLDGTLFPVTLGDLEKKFGIATFHLQRVFAEVYGSSPHRYHRSVRLLHAKRRLGQGVPSSEVATEVGYADPSSFSKAFAQKFGLPPSAFRKNGQVERAKVELD